MQVILCILFILSKIFSMEKMQEPRNETSPPKKNRGRVDILRMTAGRGGKTVTVVKNFVGIGLPEKEQLAREMQKACGTGGTVKEGRIEIQGDKRDEVAQILLKAGFKPVFAGGCFGRYTFSAARRAAFLINRQNSFFLT